MGPWLKGSLKIYIHKFYFSKIFENTADKMLLHEEHAPHFAPFFLFPSLKRIDIHKIKNISSNKHGLRLPKRLFPKNVKDKSDIMHNRQNQRQGSVRSCPRRHRVVSRRRWTGNELTIFIIIVLIRKFGGHLFAT